ncbi:MAG TPA: hypothetical protein VK116_14905, partial [Planctomycetota bacterium]|nr:hypothetical protein [Planctomycetota bacterium]
MTFDCLRKLLDYELDALARALRGGRLRSPVSALAVGRLLSASKDLAEPLAAELARLLDAGTPPALLGELLDAWRAEREERRSAEDLVDLVVTGPEAAGNALRDTAVVVSDLFRHAM